jgi:hypothetical protein
MGVFAFRWLIQALENTRGGTVLAKKMKKALKQPAFTTITITKVL